MTETWVKVHFDLDIDDWHGHGGEFMWATPITESERRVFEIRNSPFLRGESIISTSSGRRPLRMTGSLISWKLLSEGGTRHT